MSVFDERLDAVERFLVSRGCVLVEKKEIAGGQASQLKFKRNGKKGPVFNLWQTGSHHLAGQQIEDLQDEVNALLNGGSPSTVMNRKVFVVYGHDRPARDQLEALLRQWRLEPLILEKLASGGQTIIEKLEEYQNEAHYAVVLVTPDDEGYKKGEPETKADRARQNVVLELGMLLAKLGRERVAILIPSSTEMERPSDINGLLYIPYVTSVQDASVQLIKEMTRQGIHIDTRDI